MWLQLAFPAEDLIIRAVIEIMNQSIGRLSISTNFGVLWNYSRWGLAGGGELLGVSLEVYFGPVPSYQLLFVSWLPSGVQLPLPGPSSGMFYLAMNLRSVESVR